MLDNKKAFIHHPLVWVIIAFLLGAIIMYFVAKGIIPLPLNVCNVQG